MTTGKTLREITEHVAAALEHSRTLPIAFAYDKLKVDLQRLFHHVDGLSRGFTAAKCQGSQCGRNAAAKVYWPGREPLDMCVECSDWSRRIGEAIGLNIPVTEYPESSS